jgi:hypothetical protein
MAGVADPSREASAAPAAIAVAALFPRARQGGGAERERGERRVIVEFMRRRSRRDVAATLERRCDGARQRLPAGDDGA